MRLVRRILLVVAVAALLAAAGGLGGGGWYLSDILKKDALMPEHTPAELDMRVVSVREGEITLGVTPQTSNTGPWKHEGVWGLRWEGGYGQVGAISQLTDQQVVRSFTPVTGKVQAGSMAQLDSFAFEGDAQTALGIPFREVTYSSPVGLLGAWYVEGGSKTWAIFVHGRNATPREGLRILPALVGLRYPTLLIKYRNDEGAPPDPDGFLRYGQAEWQDLEAAVRYARQQGAQEVVLLGFSMGGAIVLNFLYRSPEAANVRGVILDAPMANFNETIDLGVRQRGYPVLVAGVAKVFASPRFGVDWGKLDYLKDASRLKAPVLLFHGDADPTVPVETSDALAKTRSDIVRYVRVPGALHVGSWNRGPAAYEAAVRDFLTGLGTN